MRSDKLFIVVWSKYSLNIHICSAKSGKHINTEKFCIDCMDMYMPETFFIHTSANPMLRTEIMGLHRPNCTQIPGGGENSQLNFQLNLPLG